MPFTPLSSLIGGFMLSAATSSLLAGQGRVLGISGIAHSVVGSTLTSPASKDGTPAPNITWKHAAFAGLLAGGALLRLSEGRLTSFVGASVFDGAAVGLSTSRVLLAGLAVGLGTKLGCGCTSGHMLCGLARMSRRSFIATCTFFAAALVTAQLSPAALPLATSSSSPTFSLSTLALLQVPFLIYTLAPSIFSSSIAEFVSSFFVGIHFAFGLALAGMTAPSKVLGFFHLPLPFLPLAGQRTWDPSLIMVALGGLLPNILVWRSVKQWKQPLNMASWDLPTRKDIDWKLVGGSALFGVGWGLMGVCPGPMLAVLGAGKSLDMVGPFFAAFAAGGLLGGLI